MVKSKTETSLAYVTEEITKLDDVLSKIDERNIDPLQYPILMRKKSELLKLLIDAIEDDSGNESGKDIIALERLLNERSTRDLVLEKKKEIESIEIRVAELLEGPEALKKMLAKIIRKPELDLLDVEKIYKEAFKKIIVVEPKTETTLSETIFKLIEISRKLKLTPEETPEITGIANRFKDRPEVIVKFLKIIREIRKNPLFKDINPEEITKLLLISPEDLENKLKTEQNQNIANILKGIKKIRNGESAAAELKNAFPLVKDIQDLRNQINPEEIDDLNKLITRDPILKRENITALANVAEDLENYGINDDSATKILKETKKLTKEKKRRNNLYKPIEEAKYTEESMRHGMNNELTEIAIDIASLPKNKGFRKKTLSENTRIALTVVEKEYRQYKASHKKTTKEQYLKEHLHTIIKTVSPPIDKYRDSTRNISPDLKEARSLIEGKYNAFCEQAENSDVSLDEYLKKHAIKDQNLITEIRKNKAFKKNLKDKFKKFKNISLRDYIKLFENNNSAATLVKSIKNELKKHPRLKKYVSFIDTDILKNTEIDLNVFTNPEKKEQVDKIIKELCNEIKRSIENPKYMECIVNQNDDELYLKDEISTLNAEPIGSITIKPTQRLPRYILILKEIKNALTPPNDDLSDTINEIEKTMEIVDKRIKEIEQAKRTKQYGKVRGFHIIDQTTLKIFELHDVYPKELTTKKEAEEAFKNILPAIENPDDVTPEELADLLNKHGFRNPYAEAINIDDETKIRSVSVNQARAIREAYFKNLRLNIHPALEEAGIPIPNFSSVREEIQFLKEISSAIKEENAENFVKALENHEIKISETQAKKIINRSLITSEIPYKELRAWIEKGEFKPSKVKLKLSTRIKTLFTKKYRNKPRLFVLREMAEAYKNKDFKKLAEGCEEIGFPITLATNALELEHESNVLKKPTDEELTMSDILSPVEEDPLLSPVDKKLLEICLETVESEESYKEDLSKNMDLMLIKHLMKREGGNLKSSDLYKKHQKKFKEFKKVKAKITIEEYLNDYNNLKDSITILARIFETTTAIESFKKTKMMEKEYKNLAVGKPIENIGAVKDALIDLYKKDKEAQKVINSGLNKLRKPGFDSYLLANRNNRSIRSALNNEKNYEDLEGRLSPYTELIKSPDFEHPPKKNTNYHTVIESICRNISENILEGSNRSQLLRTIVEQPNYRRHFVKLNIHSIASYENLSILPVQRGPRYQILLKELLEQAKKVKAKEIERAEKLKEAGRKDEIPEASISEKDLELLEKTLAESVKFNEELNRISAVNYLSKPIHSFLDVAKNDPKLRDKLASVTIPKENRDFEYSDSKGRYAPSSSELLDKKDEIITKICEEMDAYLGNEEKMSENIEAILNGEMEAKLLLTKITQYEVMLKGIQTEISSISKKPAKLGVEKFLRLTKEEKELLLETEPTAEDMELLKELMAIEPKIEQLHKLQPEKYRIIIVTSMMPEEDKKTFSKLMEIGKKLIPVIKKFNDFEKEFKEKKEEQEKENLESLSNSITGFLENIRKDGIGLEGITPLPNNLTELDPHKLSEKQLTTVTQVCDKLEEYYQVENNDYIPHEEDLETVKANSRNIVIAAVNSAAYNVSRLSPKKKAAILKEIDPIEKTDEELIKALEDYLKPPATNFKLSMAEKKILVVSILKKEEKDLLLSHLKIISKLNHIIQNVRQLKKETEKQKIYLLLNTLSESKHSHDDMAEIISDSLVAGGIFLDEAGSLNFKTIQNAIKNRSPKKIAETLQKQGFKNTSETNVEKALQHFYLRCMPNFSESIPTENWGKIHIKPQTQKTVILFRKKSYPMYLIEKVDETTKQLRKMKNPISKEYKSLEKKLHSYLKKLGIDDSNEFVKQFNKSILTKKRPTPVVVNSNLELKISDIKNNRHSL